MKKLILALLVGLMVAGTAQAGILTNNNKVDWDADYFGIDLSIVDDIFFRTEDDGRMRVIVYTRQYAMNVPEFFNWAETHNRSTTAPTEGIPAELVDGKVRFSTKHMFQDLVPGCHGIFQLKQNFVGVTQTIVPNKRGVEVVYQVGNQPPETTVPSNLPCMGTSEGFENWSGEASLRASVYFTPEQEGEFVTLVLAVNALRELSSDEGAFDTALVNADKPTLPNKLFSSQ